MSELLAKLLSPIFLPMGVSYADLLFYLDAVSVYLLVLLAAFVIMLAVMFIARRVKKGWKCFVRLQASSATVLLRIPFLHS